MDWQANPPYSTPLPINQSTNQSTNRPLPNPKPHIKLQVDQYANLFDGARKEVGAISSEESIEGRRSQYQTMITNFYDLVGHVWGAKRFVCCCMAVHL